MLKTAARTAVLAAILGLAGQALASDRGPVTNLPLPRFVSLKTDEGNARRGPSTGHRIDWVFTRRDMPLEVIGEYGHWRQVRDRGRMVVRVDGAVHPVAQQRAVVVREAVGVDTFALDQARVAVAGFLCRAAAVDEDHGLAAFLKVEGNADADDAGAEDYGVGGGGGWCHGRILAKVGMPNFQHRGHSGKGEDTE